VFGNQLAEVDNMVERFYPLGIWHDHLVVTNRLEFELSDDSPAELLVYNLKNGQSLQPGVYFDAVKPDDSGRIFLYKYDREDKGKREAYYRGYFFSLFSDSLEPTGETKICAY
jgi:hypothetical protein